MQLKGENQNLDSETVPTCYTLCSRPTSQGHAEEIADWEAHCGTWWPEIRRLAWLETRGGDHPSSDVIPKELMFINLLSETHAWFGVLLTGSLQADFLSLVISRPLEPRLRHEGTLPASWEWKGMGLMWSSLILLCSWILMVIGI